MARTITLLVCLLGLTGSLAGQAAVEYGAVTGAGAAGSAGAMKDASKSIGAALGNLDKTLEKGEAARTPAGNKKTAPAKPARSAAVARTKSPAPPRAVQSGDIHKGMTRADLVTKLGRPFMKTSRMDGEELVESYCYQGAEDLIVVTLRNGAVTAVSPEPEEPASGTPDAKPEAPRGVAGVTRPQSSP